MVLRQKPRPIVVLPNYRFFRPAPKTAKDLSTSWSRSKKKKTK